MSRWKPYLVGAAAGLFVAVLGGTMTDTGPWYRSLHKPWFQPPDWLFGPAWTLIYGLIVVSAATAWRAAADRRGLRDAILVMFLLNATLNVAWSGLFFALRRPDWAFVEVVFLWASILALIVMTWRVSRLASLLLVPYLAWVSFAAVLNWSVVRLNAPFG